MNFTYSYLLVFVGAGVGGSLRHAGNRLSVAVFGTNFPWNTAIINVTGSLAMGLIVGWFALRGKAGGSTLQLFLTTGVLGGYTTFSAFSLDAVALWERGQIWSAGLYVAGSVGVSLLALFAGMALMRTVFAA